MLKLGGIDNSSPKTAQTPGRFRVARNVYPTRDGRLIPRYDYALQNNLPAGTINVHDIAQYGSDVLYFTSYFSDPDYFGRFVKNSEICPTLADGAIGSPIYAGLSWGIDGANAVTHLRRNNTLYFNNPHNAGSLMKYDGVEISTAGVGQPKINSTSFNTAGTKFVKVISHTIDFDDNEPMGQDVTFPVLAATTSVDMRGCLASDNMYVRAADWNVTGTKTDGGDYELNGFKCTTVYNAGTQDFTSTITSGSCPGSVGSYVCVALDSTAMTAFSSTPTEYVGICLKIKAKDGSTVTLDATNAYFRTKNREWVLQSISSGLRTGAAAAITRGGRKFISIWASPSQNGIYSFQKFQFHPVDSSDTSTVSIANPPAIVSGSSNCISIIGPTLDGIYDVTSTKQSFNTIPFSDTVNNLHCGMTLFQDMLLMFDAKGIIWFTDTTLGGVFEMGESAKTLLVGDSGAGRITSICGTQDFLFVSRERANYYVTGNIATGNYQVQEIIDAEVGAWTNNASINVKNTVIFLTSAGVYQLTSGGRVSLLSKYCPKNFATYDDNDINEDVSFRMTGTVSTYPNTEGANEGIAVAYDEYRSLLVFMKKVANNPCLVMSTETGEFYEWDGIFPYSTDQCGNALTFIGSNYYVGGGLPAGTNTEDANTGIEEKDSESDLEYVTDFPVKLYSSWLTGGEPSLEKELLQLKIFGRISTGDSEGIKVKHYKDWDISQAITDTMYLPKDPTATINNQVQYSHKKRLNSDKVLAASIGIEIDDPACTFEIESMEVEFNSIQTGIKR